MISLYIAICVIWGVLMTGFMLKDFSNDSFIWILIAFFAFFIVHSVFAPISMYQNIPLMYYHLKRD